MKPLATQCTRGLRRALAPARAAARGRRLRPCATLLRRRPARPPAASRPAAPPATLAIAVNAAWHAHVHLHAVAQMLATTRRAAPAVSAIATPPRDPRHGRPPAPLSPALRAAAIRPVHGRIEPAAPARGTPPPALPRLADMARQSIGPPQVAVTGVAPSLAVRLSVMRTRALPRVVAASDSDHAAAARSSPPATFATPAHAPLVLRARRDARLATPGTALDLGGTAPLRRADLVWRKPSPADAGDAIDAPAPAPVASPAPFVPPLQVAAPATWARLDPALADRLADEVLKRVERQARIARERRGL